MNNIVNDIYNNNFTQQEPTIARKFGKKVPSKGAVEDKVVREETEQERKDMIAENERLHQLQSKKR